MAAVRTCKMGVSLYLNIKKKNMHVHFKGNSIAVTRSVNLRRFGRCLTRATRIPVGQC